MIAAGQLVGVIGLRVPGTLAYRHLAIRLVSTACKIALETEGDGDHDFEPEVVSAFGEAFNNVAVHSYRGRPAEALQIEVDWDPARLVITMIDTGRTFDPGTISPPDLDDLPERGMGLFIMTSCMDEVDYQPGPPNVLRLVKLRRREGLLPPPPDSATRAPGNDGRAGEGPLVTAELDPAAMEVVPEAERGSGVNVVAGAPGHGAAVRAGESSR